MNLPIFSALSFFIGAIPTAYLVGKALKGTDIREHGSGNVGATNAFRVFGKSIGILVFALDFFKGFLPTFIYLKLFQAAPFYTDGIIWVGLSSILGHIFSPFLKFKGGKGIATGGGVLCASFPLLFAGIILVWILSFLIFRIVSASSLAALVSLVVFGLILKYSRHDILYFTLLLLTAIWTHRANISRLLKGEEEAFR